MHHFITKDWILKFFYLSLNTGKKLTEMNDFEKFKQKQDCQLAGFFLNIFSLQKGYVDDAKELTRSICN